jgi:two-component system, sensor histidine kinase
MSSGKKDPMILVADDDENTCQLLKEYITGMGPKVDLAQDGKKTLEYLQAKDYDLVFLDCNMPELTGLEVVKYIKDKKTRPRIVMMTGYDQMNEEFASAVGVDVFLKKPILLDEIKKIIRGYRDR